MAHSPRTSRAAVATARIGVMTLGRVDGTRPDDLKREDRVVVVDQAAGTGGRVGIPHPECANRRFDLESASGLCGDETQDVSTRSESECDGEDRGRPDRRRDDHRHASTHRKDDRRDECRRPHLDPGRDGEEHGGEPRSRGHEEHPDDRDRHGDRVDAPDGDGTEQGQERLATTRPRERAEDRGRTTSRRRRPSRRRP